MIRSLTRAWPVPLLGALAGLVALALDEVLAAATLGAAIPLHPHFAVAYAVSGAVGATLVAAFAALARRGPLGAARLFATALALVYAPPVAERVYDAGLGHLPAAAAALAAALALALYPLAIALLGRVSGSLSAAATLGAMAAAAGLAVNRNLVGDPLGAAALAADLVIAGMVFALAYLVRSAGPGRTVAFASLLAAGLAVVAFLAHLEPGLGAGRPGRAPNLLLVVVDTLRADVFADVVARTPEGQALARALGDAVWFDDAIAASPWTAPSVATLLTGLHPDEHGFGDGLRRDRGRPLDRLAAGVPTVAETLDAAGYRTEALVTNPLLHPVSGLDRGFDRYELLPGPTSKLPLLTALSAAGLVPEISYQRAAAVRRRFAARLEEVAASGAPFFFWLHLLDPHRPLLEHPQLAAEPAAATLPPEERRYRREVRYVAGEVARCLALLRSHRLADRTAVVLVADHGEMFPSDHHAGAVPDGGRWAPMVENHGHALYDELVRVPLVVRPPGGVAGGRRVGALVGHVDLHDTLLGLAGLPAASEGLLPWLGLRPSGERPDHAALLGGVLYGPRQDGLRLGRWKLIAYPRSRDRAAELYDLEADPRERRDLAAERPRTVRGLSRRLREVLAAQRPAAEGEPVEIDAETRRRLQALGYLQE